MTDKPAATRQLTEQELHRTLLEYEAIIENASVGIAFTRNRRFLHCNPRFSEILGWSHGELVGQMGSVVWLSDEDYAEVGRLAVPVLSAGQAWDVERFLRRKDGSAFLCHMVAKAINPANTAEGTIWIAEDITDRKHADAVMNRVLLEQELILNNATIGIAFQRNRVILRCNAKLEELFGYGPGELVDHSTEFMFPDREAWERAGREVYGTVPAGGIYEGERHYRRKDGTGFWCRIKGKQVSLGGSDWIWIYEDITERKRAQEALLRARDELGQRVNERTAELAAANLRLQAEVGERVQAEERVRHLANHDALTGLPNRRLLRDRLAQALALAHRKRKPLAALFIDLDRFKTINDSLGHVMGDRLLQAVAKRLSETLREGDTVSRLGGDEFVVVLPEIAASGDAAVVAGKLIDTLAPPFRIDSQELHVTPSIGISLYPEDGDNPETLIRYADAAMYHAKDMGRNNYQFFTAQMTVAAAQRLQMENDLHRALERGEFLLHFQPRVDLATGTICGTEALIRWNHPDHGLVAPGRFIPVAEETGLIVPIGEWALRAACRQNVEWLRAGLNPGSIAVNLSPRQFRQRDLVEMVGRILPESGLDPSLLQLEITETSLMQTSGDTVATLDKLSAMGVGLSIDDFGVGYSSLSYLKRFPVDQLKVDQSFVRDISSDPDDATIVSAIIALGHSLKLRVVAEGVETEDQLGFVTRAGCHEAQGYYFARPLPPAEASQLLARGLPRRLVAHEGRAPI